MSEYLHVEKPFLDQLRTAEWETIDQGNGFIPSDPALSLREETEHSSVSDEVSGYCTGHRANRGWYKAKFLPHFDKAGVIQHITYHLGDSIPRSMATQMQQKLDLIPVEQRTDERRRRIQKLLDAGYGSCILRRDDCAKIIEDSFLFGHGERYRLLYWNVMPNHVHVMIEQRKGWPLAKVVQSWKRHTSRQIHLLLSSSPSSGSSPSCTRLPSPPSPSSGSSPSSTRLPSSSPPTTNPPLWQIDYFDRYIRNDKHYYFAMKYIENNPVNAGLISKAEDWRWSSAWKGRVTAGEGNWGVREELVCGSEERWPGMDGEGKRIEVDLLGEDLEGEGEEYDEEIKGEGTEYNSENLAGGDGTEYNSENLAGGDGTEYNSENLTGGDDTGEPEGGGANV